MHIGGLIRRLEALNTHSHAGSIDLQGMTQRQLGVLNALYEMTEEGLQPNQRMLEKRMYLSNPTVTGLLDRLEAKGMVKRVRDREDLRSKRIELTQAGIQCRMRVHKMLDETEIRLTQCLTQDEILQLQELLLRMIQDLEKREERKE